MNRFGSTKRIYLLGGMGHGNLCSVPSEATSRENIFLRFAGFVANWSLRSHNYAPCHEGVWGSGVKAPPFLPSTLNEDELSASRPGRFTLW
jgi:hypothetical protein